MWEIGMAARRDVSIVPLRMQCPTAVRDANFKLGKGRCFEALHCNVFEGSPSSDVLGGVALLVKDILPVGVKDSVDSRIR
jgi:hypothetical protein